jgi:hypothetical protein
MTTPDTKSFYLTISLETTGSDAHQWYAALLSFVAERVAQRSIVATHFDVVFSEGTDEDEDDLRRIREMRGL